MKILQTKHFFQVEKPKSLKHHFKIKVLGKSPPLLMPLMEVDDSLI
jgi:hypothetical protein